MFVLCHILRIQSGAPIYQVSTCVCTHRDMHACLSMSLLTTGFGKHCFAPCAAVGHSDLFSLILFLLVVYGGSFELASHSMLHKFICSPAFQSLVITSPRSPPPDPTTPRFPNHHPQIPAPDDFFLSRSSTQCSVPDPVPSCC